MEGRGGGLAGEASLFAASLVVGVVSVVPVCAMARGGPGGGAKAKVHLEDRSRGTKFTLSEGVQHKESESVEKEGPLLGNQGFDVRTDKCHPPEE